MKHAKENAKGTNQGDTQSKNTKETNKEKTKDVNERNKQKKPTKETNKGHE